MTERSPQILSKREQAAGYMQSVNPNIMPPKVYKMDPSGTLKLTKDEERRRIRYMSDAMCLWEAMLEARMREQPGSEPDRSNDQRTQMSQLWDNVGTSQMRDYCARMIDDLNVAWDAMDEGYTDTHSFDWEFCPLFVAHVRWDASGHLSTVIDSDGKRIAAEITAVRAMGLE